MGFFDFFKRKTETPDSTLEFSELGPWLNDRVGEEQEKIVANSHPLVSDIAGSRDKLTKLVESIGTSSVPEGVHPKFRKIIAKSKSGYVEAMLDKISSLEVGSEYEYDYAGLTSFSSSVREFLDQTAKVGVGQGRYMPLAFGDQIEKIQREGKNILKNVGELDELLASGGVNALTGIRKKYSQFSEKQAVVSQLESKKKSLSTELSGLEKDLVNSQKKYGSFTEPEELLECRREYDEVVKELAGIESSVHSHLAPLGRVMRKFRRYAGGKEEYANLLDAVDDYTTNPAESFLTDSGGYYKQILNSIRKELESGSLGDKDKSKTLKKIESAVDYLGAEVIEEYKKLEETAKKLKKEIDSSTHARDKEKLGRRLGELEARVDSIRKELESVEEEIKNSRLEVKSVKEELAVGLKKFSVTLVEEDGAGG